MEIAERTATWRRERRVLLRVSRAAWRPDREQRFPDVLLAPGFVGARLEYGRNGPRNPNKSLLGLL